MSAPLALVTGAPGWLGTRLVASLLHGQEDVAALRRPEARTVRCLVYPGTDTSELRAMSDRVQIVEGDLTAPETLEAFADGAAGGTVFHGAGIIHPSSGTKQFMNVNVEGTRHLLRAAAAAHVRRFVHVSSNSPLGTNPSRDHVFDESTPYNPYMGYGRSKMLAEQLVNEAGQSGAIETVIIRPPWFYGPGQPPRQTLFFTMIKDGKVPIVGNGTNRRSMAYVDNICQGLLLCERTAAASGQTYWIADRKSYTMSEIVDTVERVLEESFDIRCAHKRTRLPGFVSDIAQVVDGGLQALGFYQQKVHVLSEMNKTIACTIAKAERELGYDPQVELAEGMRRSIAAVLSKGGVI